VREEKIHILRFLINKMFLILESLADGAERMGLDKDTVKNLNYFL